MKMSGKSSSDFIDKDYDSAAAKSSSLYSQAMKRRSWNGAEISALIVKHEMKPTAQSRSACASPIRSTKSDSSGETSCSKTKRNHVDLTSKFAKNSKKSMTSSMSMKSCEKKSLDTAVISNNKKSVETKIQWNSLPSNLVRLGKELQRHRDVALLAVVEALQEASAAEKLLKYLSNYSELHSAKGEKQQPPVNTFFNLEENLADTILIVQSLTNVSPARANDHNDPKSHASIQKALKLAVDRKRNATLWIKAALASDLTPPFALESASMGAKNSMRKPTITACSNKPRGCMIKKQRNNGDVQVGLPAEKVIADDWIEGSCLRAAAELTNCLHEECRRWFLGYDEGHLDDVRNKTIST